MQLKFSVRTSTIGSGGQETIGPSGYPCQLRESCGNKRRSTRTVGRDGVVGLVVLSVPLDKRGVLRSPVGTEVLSSRKMSHQR